MRIAQPMTGGSRRACRLPALALPDLAALFEPHADASLGSVSESNRPALTHLTEHGRPPQKALHLGSIGFLAAASNHTPLPTYPKTHVWGFGHSSRTPGEPEWTVSTGKTWACCSRGGRTASGCGEFRIFDPNGNALSTSAYGWTRLFQGREYIPMLDAYDFRARTLWPELGRFGQEDPAGTVDSTNRYQALGGRWNGVTDPLGLYEEDVHHYLTTYLARAVGFGPGIADAIGRQTGLLDFDERDAMYPDDPAERAADLGANVPNMNMYHFPMPSRLQEMFREATDPKTKGRLVAIGEYIHGFQDSFAHQRNVNNPSFKMYYDDAVPGKGWIGHGWHGHDPDHTWKRPIDFGLRMAEETYAELCTIYRSLHGNIAPTTRRSFSDLRQTIERFLAAPSPSDIYMQPFAGGVVWFENVRDYTDKIQRLDVGFSPTSYERAYREKKYAETKEVERSLRERADRRTMH